MLFSAGCHAGLSVPQAYAANPALPGDTGTAADWAQEFGSRAAAVWVANTGFGYGAVGDVALSERLMALYAKYLVDPSSANSGDALRRAKQEYFLGQGVYGSYDEKVLEQVVFYGIPTYKFGNQTGIAGTGDTLDADRRPDGTGGMPASASISKTFSHTPNTQNGRTSYSIDGETLALNGYPVTPKQSFGITSTDPSLTARGAIIESMEATVETGITPQMVRAVSDLGNDEPAPQPATMVFPTTFQTISGNAQQQRLVVYPGQFSDDRQRSRRGCRRAVAPHQGVVQRVLRRPLHGG